MSQNEQDSGKTYADIWGEAVHSNRHLRVLSMGLAGLVLLLVVIIIRLSSVELPKPIVVRVDEVDRAAPVLKSWTQDGDGQGAPDPAGPTQADPEIRQEIARLRAALTTGNRQMLREWGTFEKAADRILYLEELPAGTPTKTTARGAIDRFTIWPTVRLTTPEVAI